MTAIDVDGLRFEFDNTWIALKWDNHAAYRHGLNGHGGTKALDIFALRHEDELWLIECGVVRTQAHRIAHRNTRRTRDEPLHDEFVSKVRDSIAAAVWAQDRQSSAGELIRYLKAGFRSTQGKVHVVLWFEGLDVAELMALEDLVRARLKWLSPKVHILSAEICTRYPQKRLDGVSVSNAP
jgi:hypothetical protein